MEKAYLPQRPHFGFVQAASLRERQPLFYVGDYLRLEPLIQYYSCVSIGGNANNVLAVGKFQQLEKQADQGQYPNRFVLLRELIQEIAQEPGIELLELEVKPLPQVPRCSYHMMDEDTPRCYLMARFRLEDDRERYLWRCFPNPVNHSARL